MDVILEGLAVESRLEEDVRRVEEGRWLNGAYRNTCCTVASPVGHR
jgi:hypothetical protein